MELLDNVSKTLRDDLRSEIEEGSKLSIAATCYLFLGNVGTATELKRCIK